MNAVDDRIKLEEELRRRELARQDLNDIKFLTQHVEFTRYWPRRLKDKQAALEKRFRDEDPSKCDKDEREVLRRLIKEYDSLIAMMKSDEAGCIRTLESLQYLDQQGR